MVRLDDHSTRTKLCYELLRPSRSFTKTNVARI
jgi:hypothetical protein